MSRQSLCFILFCLLTGVLFLRPAELIPSLAGSPVYEVIILCNLIVAAPNLLEQVQAQSLKVSPSTVCVLGLWVAVGASHLTSSLGGVFTSLEAFMKVVLTFLLVIAVLDTPRRLRFYLWWLLLLIVASTVLALLQYHEVINLPTLAVLYETQYEGDEVGQLARLSGAGIFANPNDLSRILVMGITIAIYLFDGGAPLLLRPLWLCAILLLTYALVLTHSRGGLLGLVAGLAVYFYCRFGWRKTLLLGCAGLPILAVVFGGRQTDISTSTGTGHHRIELWGMGLEALRASPLLGLGMNTYPDVAEGYVAHNSYVHSYVELGLFGGTMFIGAFLSAGCICYRAAKAMKAPDPLLLRVRPCLLAILCGYAVGMLSSSRCYAIPTYLLLGLVVTHNRLARADVTLPSFWVTPRSVIRLVIISFAFLLLLQSYVIIKLR